MELSRGREAARRVLAVVGKRRRGLGVRDRRPRSADGYRLHLGRRLPGRGVPGGHGRAGLEDRSRGDGAAAVLSRSRFPRSACHYSSRRRSNVPSGQTDGHASPDRQHPAGGLTPLLPLATAFAVQGDELLVATGRDVADQVSGAGLRLPAPVWVNGSGHCPDGSAGCRGMACRRDGSCPTSPPACSARSPRCAAVVNHGGSGTMFGALAHGLGQLVLPQSADNFVNADARAGYGMLLLAEQVSPASVADAVRTLLTDPWRARRAATEIAATPGVSSAAR